MKLRISNSEVLKSKYNGTTSKMTLVDPEQYGIMKKDNWYGGNMKKAATVKDSPIVLLMTDKLKTLGVAYVIGHEGELSEEDAKQFGIIIEKKKKN